MYYKLLVISSLYRLLIIFYKIFFQKVCKFQK
nr:MAG TPA: hypothetical protein [Caudoviricetes sp.]